MWFFLVNWFNVEYWYMLLKNIFLEVVILFVIVCDDKYILWVYNLFWYKVDVSCIICFFIVVDEFYNIYYFIIN